MTVSGERNTILVIFPKATGHIVCANCHLANKPVEIEVPQAVLPDTVFEAVVQFEEITVNLRVLTPNPLDIQASRRLVHPLVLQAGDLIAPFIEERVRAREFWVLSLEVIIARGDHRSHDVFSAESYIQAHVAKVQMLVMFVDTLGTSCVIVQRGTVKVGFSPQEQ